MTYFYLTHDSPYDVVAFTVNSRRLVDKSMFGLPIIAFEEVERQYPPADYAMSIPISYRGGNRLRAERYDEAKTKGYRLISYVSSRASVWPGLVIGDNCLILEGATVQPTAQIGNDVFVGVGALISHDDVIDDHCFIAPGAIALGNVRVGPYCLLGANSTIRDGITVASECVIGAGVTIRRDTQPGEVYVDSAGGPLPKSSDQLRNWLTWGR